MVVGEIIHVSGIPGPYNPDATEGYVCDEDELFFIENLKVAKTAFEKEFIQRKLQEHSNNITQTAKAIGVGRSYLHKKLKN